MVRRSEAIPSYEGGLGRGLALFAIAVAGLALPGCNRSGHEAPPPIRIAVHSDPLSLDPHFSNEVLTFAILANVFEGLTAFDAELKLIPSLVSSWENPDERRWRLHLKTTARFHDGRPMEAEDVVASLLRVRSHPRSQLGSYIVEAESERVIDRATVEVTTRRPYAPLLNKLAFLFVVPRDAPNEITDPIGTGPYRMTRFERGRILNLTPVTGRTPGPGFSPLSPLEFHPIGNPEKRLGELLRGNVEIVQDLPPAGVKRVEESACCVVASRPSAIVEYLHFGFSDPRFKDRRVREAIHLALDRRLLVERVFRGLGQPATQMVGPGAFGFDPSIATPVRDLVRARRLLTEAGYPNGFEATLEFRIGRDGSEIARQLGEIGLRVKPQAQPWSELFARLSRREVDFYYGGVTAVTADASDVLDSFVHSRTKGYGMTNYSGYSSPELDLLIEESGATLVMAQRRGLLQKCMRLLTEDFYLLPLVIPYDLYGMNKQIDWQPRLDRLLLGREMRHRAR